MQTDYQRHATARMFENDFLEASSKIHPSVPFLFYGPIIGGAMIYAYLNAWLSPGATASMLLAGWVTWCLMEYGIHRGFFHWEGNGPITRRIHEIAHGYHHKYPDDPLRLVMPLGASIPLAIVIAGLLYLVGSPGHTIPFFCGLVAGYLHYDFLHWYVHARTPKTRWGKAMRAHHMAHHFACPDKNFGISHRWVDVLFGTLRRRRATSASTDVLA